MTTFAETNRTGLYYVEETTWGEVPTGGGNEGTPLRYTGESMNYNINYSTSQEIDPDAQVKDLVQTGAETTGGVNFELSYGSFDPFFAGALRNDWSTTVDISDNTIDVTNADTFGGTGLFGDVSVGQWIRTAGFTNTENNGVFRVTAASADAVTVDAVLVNESAGSTITVKGSMLRNGTTDKSFTIEKSFTDITKFLTLPGMIPGEMALNVAANEFLGGSFNFLGKAALPLSATSNLAQPPNAATTTRVMNAVSALSNLRIDNAAFTGLIESITLNSTLNLRGRSAVGVLGYASVGYGRYELSGDMSVYFEDGAMYNRYVNDTEAALSFQVDDVAGNTYIFSIPRFKFSAGEIVSGAINQDVMAKMTYQALMDSTTGCTFQIDRIPA